MTKFETIKLEEGIRLLIWDDEGISCIVESEHPRVIAKEILKATMPEEDFKRLKISTMRKKS